MANNKTTSGIIDGILRLLMTGGTIGAGLIAPNILQLLDKPTRKYFDKLDERSNERELQRITTYMKKRGLVEGSYAHGLSITAAGRELAMKKDFDRMQITKPKLWDNKWRLVMFDIPETHKQARDALTSKLRQLGFLRLQNSVWIFPFSSRVEVEVVSVTFGVERYVTYIETVHIDHEEKLIERFSSILKP